MSSSPHSPCAGNGMSWKWMMVCGSQQPHCLVCFYFKCFDYHNGQSCNWQTSSINGNIHAIVHRKMGHEPLQCAQTEMSGKAINAIVLLHAYSIQLQTHKRERINANSLAYIFFSSLGVCGCIWSCCRSKSILSFVVPSILWTSELNLVYLCALLRPAIATELQHIRYIKVRIFRIACGGRHAKFIEVSATRASATHKHTTFINLKGFVQLN